MVECEIMINIKTSYIYCLQPPLKCFQRKHSFTNLGFAKIIIMDDYIYTIKGFLLLFYIKMCTSHCEPPVISTCSYTRIPVGLEIVCMLPLLDRLFILSRSNWDEWERVRNRIEVDVWSFHLTLIKKDKQKFLGI